MAGATVRLRVTCADCAVGKPASVTVIVTCAVPAVFAPGVPVMAPVELLIESPLGRPVADKLTLPLKPFCGVTVIALAPLVPCAIVTLFGDAESEKFATVTGFTVRETVVPFDKLPEVPVMVTVTAPVAAVLLAVSVKVLVVVVELELKDAVTPLGNPVADKLTLPLKPF